MAISISVTAMAFSWRASSHMRTLQYLDTEVGERRTGLTRRHRHEAVPRHSRRRVHFEERIRAVLSEDQVEPAPAAAADDVERGERLRANLALLGVRYATRTEVLRVVREILVVVVVVALRRLDADQRQRAAVDDRRRQFDTLHELLDEHEPVVRGGGVEGQPQFIVVDGRNL